MDQRAFHMKEAKRLLEQFGDGAAAEARYRLTVARNRRDLPGIERWSAIGDILFQIRFPHSTICPTIVPKQR